MSFGRYRVGSARSNTTRLSDASWTDRSVRRFLEGDTAELPTFYANKIRSKLGPLWDLLPEGALMHDHLAYLHADPEPDLIEVGPPVAEARPTVLSGADYMGLPT